MNIIQVNGDVMYPYKQIHPVPKGQVRFSKIKFNFSDDWENREVIVQFVQDGKTPINKPIESDGTCFVPDSIDLGMLFVYLRGYSSDGTSIATSNGVKIPIVQGTFDGGEPEVPPSPDLYSQLVNQVSQYAEEAKSSADRAEEASVNSPKVGDNGNWFVWSFEAGKYVDTGVAASGGGSGEVLSVNGKTGAVKLGAADVGAVSAPATASVGQTVVVKVVDETGRPTEWEAVDAPSSFRLLNTIELSEEVTEIKLNADDSGNPYNFKEIIVSWFCPAMNGDSYFTPLVNGKRVNGCANSITFYIWSGSIYGVKDSRCMVRFTACGDACLIEAQMGYNNYGSNATNGLGWCYYEGAFNSIKEISWFVYNRNLPAGCKMIVFGR